MYEGTAFAIGWELSSRRILETFNNGLGMHQSKRLVDRDLATYRLA